MSLGSCRDTPGVKQGVNTGTPPTPRQQGPMVMLRLLQHDAEVHPGGPLRLMMGSPQDPNETLPA